MERRLQLVRELLDPTGAVLIVTIDEKEYARLALLLEQVFPEGRIQMVSSVINPNGSARLGELTRVNEYVFFCFFGNAQPCQVGQKFRGEPCPRQHSPGVKPDAVVLDFFAGSGTTAHAVMRLNRQDGGTRHSILITNNEVAAAEQADLRKSGLRAGDSDWEQWGICDHITKPRLEAAITGTSSAGAPIVGSYRFVDEFPMAEGIQANAAFFTLTYEQPLSVRHHRAFPRVAPMLWLRAGSVGPIISDLGEHGWATTRRYGVIADLDRTAGFLQAVNDEEQLVMVFIVTDDDSAFQMVCRNLPEDVEPVRLYESYLSNFEINAGAV